MKPRPFHASSLCPTMLISIHHWYVRCLAGSVTTNNQSVNNLVGTKESNIPINNKISTSSISARIGAKIDISTLQLLRITIASHRDHAHPQILHLLVDEVAQASVNVTGGDGVDTSEVAPLVSQRAGHVDAACLSYVVRGLLLREVGDVAGHGGRDDEGAGSSLLEVLADGLRAVEGSVEIGLDDFHPCID